MGLKYGEFAGSTIDFWNRSDIISRTFSFSKYDNLYGVLISGSALVYTTQEFIIFAQTQRIFTNNSFKIYKWYFKWWSNSTFSFCLQYHHLDKYLDQFIYHEPLRSKYAHIHLTIALFCFMRGIITVETLCNWLDVAIYTLKPLLVQSLLDLRQYQPSVIHLVLHKSV